VQTYLRRVPDSFERPLNEAIDACNRAFAEAGRTVDGAEKRTRIATDNAASLIRFIEATRAHADSRTFHSLPVLTWKGDRLDRVHVLEIAPWRGIFLVSPDAAVVIGLIFSQHPHKLESRLDEIVALYRNIVSPELG
jgi:hypothetical protein